MSGKMRWSLAVVLAGMFSVAQAATDTMVSSFGAAETGNYKQAVSIWQSLAAQGDAQAQFNLGLMYHGGLGLPRDEHEAVRLYQMAAEAGYQPAQVYLTVGYEEGWFGLPQDSNKAYYWRGVLDSSR